MASNHLRNRAGGFKSMTNGTLMEIALPIAGSGALPSVSVPRPSGDVCLLAWQGPDARDASLYQLGSLCS